MIKQPPRQLILEEVRLLVDYLVVQIIIRQKEIIFCIRQLKTRQYIKAMKQITKAFQLIQFLFLKRQMAKIYTN